MHQMKHNDSHSNNPKGKSAYGRLLGMVIISYVAMYLLMYAMVDKLDNVLPNINQLYMAALMTSPMILIELMLMGKMYPHKMRNAAIAALSIAIGFGCFVMIRKQVAVSDRQFLRSMIPHHAAAVLMVKETKIHDPEIKALADSIIAAQEREIQFMRNKLKKIENN